MQIGLEVMTNALFHPRFIYVLAWRIFGAEYNKNDAEQK